MCLCAVEYCEHTAKSCCNFHGILILYCSDMNRLTAQNTTYHYIIRQYTEPTRMCLRVKHCAEFWSAFECLKTLNHGQIYKVNAFETEQTNINRNKSHSIAICGYLQFQIKFFWIHFQFCVTEFFFQTGKFRTTQSILIVKLIVGKVLSPIGSSHFNIRSELNTFSWYFWRKAKTWHPTQPHQPKEHYRIDVKTLELCEYKSISFFSVCPGRNFGTEA